TFAANETTKTVTVNITNDDFYEGSESFSLLLSNAANATIAQNGTGTILDNGDGSNGTNDDRPSFSVANVTVNEGAGTLTFTVTKGGNTTLPSTVAFTTADGTATTADYTATNGTLTFAANETTKTVTVNITNDGVYEGSESFSLLLSNAANATIAQNGSGTIIDDGTGPGGTDDDRDPVAIDDALNGTLGGLTSANIILRNDVHRTGDVLAIADVDGTPFGNLPLSTNATWNSTDGWRSLDLDHGTLYLKSDGESHYQHHGRAFTVTPQVTSGTLEYQQPGGSWVAVSSAFRVSLAEIEAGRLRFTPAGDEIGLEGLVVAAIEEIDTTSEQFDYGVTDGVHESNVATVTYSVADPNTVLNTPLGQGSDIDYDGIASEVESTLASRVTGTTGLEASKAYLIDLANVLNVDGFATEVFRVSAYQEGDLNSDGVPDAEQNAVTTFAWINNLNFEAANDDPVSLPTVAPIVNLVAEASAVSFREGNTSIQLDNILSTPLTPQQNELLDPIFDFAPSWCPVGFSAS
ncbi:MAG: Calx-beta domain-containing protein, partial [Ilumatobacteraceae bacterium]